MSPVDMLCMSWPLLCWCKFHLHIAENKKLKINYRNVLDRYFVSDFIKGAVTVVIVW